MNACHAFGELLLHVLYNFGGGRADHLIGGPFFHADFHAVLNGRGERKWCRVGKALDVSVSLDANALGAIFSENHHC